jgi:hypothetical protein
MFGTVAGGFAADHIKPDGKHNVENVATALTLVTAPGP